MNQQAQFSAERTAILEGIRARRVEPMLVVLVLNQLLAEFIVETATSRFDFDMSVDYLQKEFKKEAERLAALKRMRI